MKQITVITSVYNKGERTRRTIEGILGQTFSDFDYLLVNDESTDETGEICCSYDDPRIIYREQSNRGFTRTMREAVAQVKTPFVAIQGAGDESLPERLAIQHEFLEKNPEVGFVGCNYSNIYPDGSLIDETKMSEMRYSGVESIVKSNPISQGEVMFRVSAYEKAGGYRDFFKFTQDYDLWFRMLKHADLVRLSEKLYVRNVDPAQDITGNPQKTAEQYILSFFTRFLAKEDLKGRFVNESIEPGDYYDEFLQKMSNQERKRVSFAVARHVRRFRSDSKSSEKRLRQALAEVEKYYPLTTLHKELKLRMKILQVSPVLYSCYFLFAKAVYTPMDKALRKLGLSWLSSFRT